MRLESLLNVIIIVTVFALIFSLWCCILFAWLGLYLGQLKKIRQRLGLAGEETPDEAKMLKLWQDSQGSGHGRKEKISEFQKKLNRIGHDAGWQVSFNAILLGVAGACLLSALLTYVFTNSKLVAVACALVVVCGFVALTNRKIDKRTALFESQLVDALGIAARSLRAGHPLAGSFQLVSEEIGPPIGDVFYRICQEQSLGLDLKDSIRKVSSETSNTELRLFATAVAIQLQSGGNLADLMDNLQSVIRARIKLVRRARILTAQTNLSARILIGLPIFLFFLLNIISPKYMYPLYHTTLGRYILTLTIVLVLFGWWIMKRITVLRY